MYIYKAEDGRWIVYNNGIKSIYFDTEAEALEMSEKIQFAERTMALSKALIDVIKELPTIEKIWALEGYLAGMSDEDIESTGKTKAEVTAFVTFSENFTKFLKGATGADAPTVAEYQDTLYRLLESP